MKLIKIKAGEKAEVIELEGNKIDYIKIKELLDIDSPVTCVERIIGMKGKGEWFDLWADDEGLLKPDRIVSGVLVIDNPMLKQEILCGNMLIMKHDDEGNSIGLTDEEIKMIMRYIVDNDEFCKFNHESIDKDRVLNYIEWGEVTIKAHSNWLMYRYE